MAQLYTPLAVDSIALLDGLGGISFSAAFEILGGNDNDATETTGHEKSIFREVPRTPFVRICVYRNATCDQDGKCSVLGRVGP